MTFTPIPLPVRVPHEGTVLKLLRDQGPSSRTTIARLAGLSPATITKAVTPLLEAGLLTESPGIEGRLGRPALTLTPIPASVTVCGVQIGGGKVRLGLTDAAGVVRGAKSYDFPRHEPVEAVFARVANEIAALLAADTGASCVAIGVGVPGPVDRARRRNVLSLGVDWHDVPVADMLESAVGIPVVADHNVRTLALSEARYGTHAADSLAYFYVRNGVGLGLVLNGEPFYGGRGGGETFIGHTRVVDGGQLCVCGERGCLGTLLGEPYVSSELSRITGTAPSDKTLMPYLHALAKGGNTRAIDLEESLIHHASNSLASIINLFTPEVTLVGGMLAAMPEDMLHTLRERTRDRIVSLLRDDLRLEAAGDETDDLIRGAAALALEVFLYT